MQLLYLTYLLTNTDHDAFYVGVTRDFELTLMAHRQGIADDQTKAGSVFRLVWFQEFYDLISALRRKGQVSRLTSLRKTVLVQRANPGWQELGAPQMHSIA